MTKRRVVAVDADTGEMVQDGSYYVRNRKQDEAYRRKQNGRNHDFTFTDMESINRVIAAIDEKHCGYLLYLQCFISYDGALTHNTHGKQPMTKADIQDAVGLKKSAFYDFFRSMTDNGIIYEEDGRYYVNNAYHFKGSTNNANTIKSFTAKVKELYSARNAKKLGFIYKLIPYVHYETNTICANPLDRDVTNTVNLTKSDIAEITGVSEKTVYSYLRNMKLGDEFVFAEIRRGKHRFYKINPFIFYRKPGRPDATLREMFRLGFGD